MSTGATLPVIRPRKRPDATRLLICFSFCGGGTARFRPWADAVPFDTELLLYCYAGRESRFGTPYVTGWEELVDEIVGTLRALGDRPYVLFGHSMGARVAFDVSTRMERSGRPPEALVVSAAESPSRFRAESRRPPRPENTDEEIMAWMAEVGQLPAEILANRDLRQMAAEIFRADLRVSFDYRYRPGTTVGVPVHVLHGVADDQLDVAAVRAWHEVAGADLRIDELPGGHFYTPEVWSRLPERLPAVWPLSGMPAGAGPLLAERPESTGP